MRLLEIFNLIYQNCNSVKFYFQIFIFQKWVLLLKNIYLIVKFWQCFRIFFDYYIMTTTLNVLSNFFWEVFSFKLHTWNVTNHKVKTNRTKVDYMTMNWKSIKVRSHKRPVNNSRQHSKSKCRASTKPADFL